MKRVTEKLRALCKEVKSSIYIYIYITGQKHLIRCTNNLQGLELNINGVTE